MLSTTPRGRSSPTLVTFYPKGCVVVMLPYEECLVVFCTMRSCHIEGSIYKPNLKTNFWVGKKGNLVVSHSDKLYPRQRT